MDNIAALEREEFEKELKLKESGWIWYDQEIVAVGAFGGGMLRVDAVGETYGRGDEVLQFWWISPDNIGRVVKNGKEYPNPSEQVLRMLVK